MSERPSDFAFAKGFVAMNMEFQKAMSRINELEEALSFYANVKSWETTGHPQIDADLIPARRDNGELARHVLNQGESG